MSVFAWTSLGGGDQEAFEFDYVLRIEVDAEGGVTWRVGTSGRDAGPDWLVDGRARTGASARRLARGVARLLWKEVERREERLYRKSMRRKAVQP